ncbi:MAG TPA: antitoxin [Solibacterales bacterium]|nr:antitoxin [Bryobacterales bacterium]
MDRIDINPAVCSGKPVIRGTRIMVRNILGMVAGGYTVDRIVESYPELKREDVAAALEYAARVVDEDQVAFQ